MQLVTQNATGWEIDSLSFYKGKLMYHSGVNLYQYDPQTKETTQIGGRVANQPGQGFVFNGIWYYKSAYNYIQYDGIEAKSVSGYVPTTTIGKPPSGGGTVHEDVNILTTRRINTFVADGKSTIYHLDAKNIYADSAAGGYVVKVNDEKLDSSQYTVNAAEGTVTFVTAPEEPGTPGQDNVSVEFNAGTSQNWEIWDCKLAQVFDNRVFFSGNELMPNTVWYSGVNDPTYVSDQDSFQEGLDGAAVRGLVAGNNALWVFKEASDENATVFYHQPVLDAQYGKIYPSVHSSIAAGCVGRAINFNDDIVFFSERGMEGVSGSVTSEQIVAHRSSLVDTKMTAEEKYKDMLLAEWEGYLLVFVGNKIYLADSRATFANENHMEYEWFYWEEEATASSVTVQDNILYIGTKDGRILSLNGPEAEQSYWVTAKEKFQFPNRLKTTNKRGCVAEATGDVAVYAKTEDSGFELIAEHTGVEDYFVSRIKRKKFKDIQLKFHSKTGFSLESVTLEAFVGGYIKR
jgi:hypothetical protein